MAARVVLREITNEEGNRLLRIVRRDSGSVVTWRRAQIVLLSAQRMSPAKISEVVFTDPDTVREVIHNFNRDGFDALYPRYAGGRPPTFTLPQRREIKKIALSIPTDLGRPFATWSLAKLADYLVAEGVVTDISHEGLRALLREEGVSFQAVRTWKRSNDPNFEPKKNRILELYEAADAGKAIVICLDEFGPLNLQPQPGGKAWAPLRKPRRIRATYTRPHGVRHMLGADGVEQPLVCSRVADQSLPGPGERVRGGLVTGEDESEQLRPNFPIGQHLAVLGAGLEQHREDVAALIQIGGLLPLLYDRVDGAVEHSHDQLASPYRLVTSSIHQFGELAHGSGREVGEAPYRRAKPVLGGATLWTAPDAEDPGHDHVEGDRLHPRRQRHPLIERPAVDLAFCRVGDRLYVAIDGLAVEVGQEQPTLAHMAIAQGGENGVRAEDRSQRRLPRG
jgi:transposase